MAIGISTALLLQLFLSEVASGQMRWCYLSDNPNWPWIQKDPSQAFAVECIETCLKREENIWGTELYSYDSNICRAAVHDGRLSWWNSQSNRVVHIQRHPDVLSYLGSTRFGITSDSYGALRYKFGCFRFTSPRISEPILDLTLLTRPALYSGRDAVTLECHAGTNALGRELVFGSHAGSVPERTIGDKGSARDSKLPSEAAVDIITHSVQRTWFELVLPSSVEERRTGAYYCTFQDSIPSRVITLSMRADAYFLPSSVTRTVSVGDTSVTLTVDVQFAMGGQWTTQWYKDGQLVSTGPHLTIGQVQLGHTGIYSILHKDATRLDRRALLRLIVRACPDNKFGSSSCDHRCPICLNGGICHDISGECVCPPGFHGLACEIACPPNWFGHNCSSSCSDDDDSTDGCEGTLLCVSDPFGCSCPPGFTGSTCNSHCNPGTYGAGCTQQCGRCLKDSPCDRFTGVCIQGCESGWKGSRCVITLPRLKGPPNLLEATSESLSIGWSAWDPAIDPGDGHAVAYLVQHRERGKPEWQQDSFPGHVLHGTFNYTMASLRPETDYQVRVLVLDQSGIVAKDSAPIGNYSTVCEAPSQPPNGIQVENTNPHYLAMTWKVPAKETWRCREVTFSVRYCSGSSDDAEWRRVTDLNDTRFILESLPFTSWNLQVRTENLAGASNWSVKVTTTTGQDAPGSVTGLQTSDAEGPQSIRVVWGEPSISNGLITLYEVDVGSADLLACRNDLVGLPTDSSNDEKSHTRLNTTDRTAEVSGLQAYSEYAVSVRAWTIKPGPFTNVMATTAQAVPSAPPQRLRTWYSYETELAFLWDSPPCENMDGQVVAYLCVFEGLDPWVIDGEQRYIVEHKTTRINGNISTDALIRIESLIPFTSYSFRVHAGTSVGFSDTSALITARTNPNVPPPPTNVSIFAKSWTSLSVSWSPPYPAFGKPELFVIHLDPCLDGNSCNKTLSAQLVSCSHPARREQKCFTWGNLVANRSYTLWLSVKNVGVIGFSNPCDPLTVETVESTPGPPWFIRYTNINLTTVLVKWDNPLVTSGTILHYRINFSIAETTSKDQNKVWRLDRKTFVVPTLNIEDKPFEFWAHGLLPRMRYRISVEGFTSAGYGTAAWAEATTEVPRLAGSSFNTDASDQQYVNSNTNRHQGSANGKTKDNGSNSDKNFDSEIIIAGVVGTVLSILILLSLVVLVLFIIKRKPPRQMTLVADIELSTRPKSLESKSSSSLDEDEFGSLDSARRRARERTSYYYCHGSAYKPCRTGL